MRGFVISEGAIGKAHRTLRGLYKRWKNNSKEMKDHDMRGRY